MSREAPVLLWRSKDPFSQWHEAGFTLCGDHFVTAEHYMMVSKSGLFGDARTERRMWVETSPRAHKRLGRKVQGFDAAAWDAVAPVVVFEGTVALAHQAKRNLV